jgi:hypothetical protein
MGPAWDPYFNPQLVKSRVQEHYSGTYARNGKCKTVEMGNVCGQAEYISYTTGGRGTSTHPHAGTVISNPFQPTSMTYSHRTVHPNPLIYMVLVLGSISVR